MRYFHLFSAGVALLLAGCSFLSSSYREPEVFDLPPTAAKSADDVLPECVLGTIRNLSGADRRFLFRAETGRMEADEYSRWLLTPDLMLERQLMAVLDSRPAESGLRNYLQLNAVIRRFEFDRAGNQALFDVEFTVRVFRDRQMRRSVSENIRCFAPVTGDRAGDYAAAMTRCFHDAAESARKLLKEMDLNQ